uniref:Uncharacterized protein n=1 Tax=viral metagenome TaxID=1070528 RepID=A0A6C0E147_9ZZZZ
MERLIAIQFILIYQSSLQRHNSKDLYHQVVNIIDVYDEFVDDYKSKNNSNILWSETLNNLFYNLLQTHQDNEMFNVKDLDKLLRFFIKRKVPYNRFFLDEPDVEYKIKFSSCEKNKIFTETIKNVRNNIKIHVINTCNKNI